MPLKIRKDQALQYHKEGKPGKIEVIPTKSLTTQRDLALAYSPGVAEPCLEIAANKEKVYDYTAKGNLVAVISNGTAVLGLGNIGAEASKPVMEGKGVLFKKFAGIDVFDIEINTTDPKEFVQVVKALEPTFGGINLEDVKAPEAFYIEKALKEQMNIPVMHDDQHGTAIISGAALLNALDLVGKKIEELKITVNGAGASGISCSHLYIALGVRRENIIMLDSKGVIRKDRPDLPTDKGFFATDKDIHTLDQAIAGADMFLGLSKGDILTPKMVKKMAKDPIVFALANPNPEIDYHLAMKTRKDIIMATGRSDYPNQVNNVLGFPYIFRGALDVRATEINEAMKLAAVRAIAELAKEPVHDMVNKVYNDNKMSFGKDYLIPKPIDPRLITKISSAVAKAAMDSGASPYQSENWNWEQYHIQLQERLGYDQRLVSRMIQTAQKDPKRVIFAEADNHKVLKAAQIVQDEGIAEPILLGNKKKIHKLIKENNLSLGDCPIIDPLQEPELCEKYGNILYKKRQRKGVTAYEAKKLMRDRNYFGTAMLHEGEADAFISGLTKNYPKIIKPAIEVIGTEEGVNRVAGMFIMTQKDRILFFADTNVNENPTSEEIVEIIGLAQKAVKFFGYTPKIALLSHSNFGSVRSPNTEKASESVAKAKEMYPDLIIDGELQANVALDKELLKENYPFSPLATTGVNTLIFPSLEAGNIAYKLLQELGTSEAIGPVLMGMKKPVHILQLGSEVREIVNMVAIAVVDAQYYESKHRTPVVTV